MESFEKSSGLSQQYCGRVRERDATSKACLIAAFLDIYYCRSCSVTLPYSRAVRCSTSLQRHLTILKFIKTLHRPAQKRDRDSSHRQKHLKHACDGRLGPSGLSAFGEKPVVIA